MTITLKLRSAIRDDFTDQWDNKRIGTAYFCKNKDGILESRVYYFHENVDMMNFKTLYANGQLFVCEQ